MKNNLNTLRQHCGYTLTELANTAGLALSTVFSMECDDANPTMKNAYKVAQVLDLSVYEIWPQGE